MSDLKPVTMYCCKGCQHLHHEIVTACDCGTGCEPFEYELWEARRTQPEATAPAQDLSAAILAAVDRFLCWELPRDFNPDGGININTYGHQFDRIGYWPTGTNLFTAKQAKAMFEHCFASSANALSAGDRVDAERYRHLRELMQFSTPPNKPTTMKLRAPIPAPEHNPHRDWIGEQFDASVDRTVDASLRACLTTAEIVDFDAARAILQSQKGVSDA